MFRLTDIVALKANDSYCYLLSSSREKKAKSSEHFWKHAFPY